MFPGLSFKNPGKIHGNLKSVRDLWEKTKIRESPGESGEAGNYEYRSAQRKYLELSSALKRWKCNNLSKCFNIIQWHSKRTLGVSTLNFQESAVIKGEDKCAALLKVSALKVLFEEYLYILTLICWWMGGGG